MHGTATASTTFAPLAEKHLDGAATLLAARHAAARLVEPSLDPRYEDPATARREISGLLGRDGASGVAAAQAGEVLGSAVGCAIELSSIHRSLTLPAGAGFLGFAAVLRQHRGLGAGRLLGEAVLHWACEAGYPAVVTDWRMTNLLSSRTWPRLGFRPTFYRLFRAIA